MDVPQLVFHLSTVNLLIAKFFLEAFTSLLFLSYNQWISLLKQWLQHFYPPQLITFHILVDWGSYHLTFLVHHFSFIIPPLASLILIHIFKGGLFNQHLHLSLLSSWFSLLLLQISKWIWIHCIHHMLVKSLPS